MPDPAIRAAGNRRRTAEHDDARGPAPAEARDHPQAADLEKNEYRQPEQIDRLVVSQRPKSEQPKPMQDDHQWVMRRAEFDAAFGAKPSGVELREPELENSLCAQECDQPGSLTHMRQPCAASSDRKFAEN